MITKLQNSTDIRVRFNEVDPLGIVWHGHYIRYFEDGREAFGAEHGLTYLDVYRHGYVTPVVKINCDYKKSLEYGDMITVITTFVNSPAAKLCFEYRIIHKETGELIAEGNSVQVFLDDQKRELQLIAPGFFTDWKMKHHLK
jgi:acyl-CoA thioester hydrolase